MWIDFEENVSRIASVLAVQYTPSRRFEDLDNTLAGYSEPSGLVM